MLKPEKTTFTYTRRIALIECQSVAECRFPQTDEIVDLIAVCPQVSLISCDVSSGRINYSGKLIYSIVYVDEEGKLCRMQKGAEFSHYTDDERFAPAQYCLCNLTCERTQIRREGSSFVISAIIGARISVFARGERDLITSCESVFLKTESKELYSAVTFSGESEVEDDFEADSVVDILIPCAHALVTNAECGAGEITVSGEIYISLFAMRKQTPVCLDRVVSFKSSIPCEDSKLGAVPDVHAEICDLNVTATVNEERGKCNVNFIGSLAFIGVFYDKSEATFATDAFSCDNKLELQKNQEETRFLIESKVYSERVSGRAASKSKLDFACNFLAAALPKAEYNFVSASGAVEGAVTAVLLYEQNGELKSTEVNLPFAVKLNSLGEGQSINADIAVCGVSIKQPDEGEIEAEAVLKICAHVYANVTAEYICDIEEGDALPECDSAISVFLPAAGDGLWEISKKLSRPPKDVQECNPELKYPLSGKERILVYRPKSV